MSNNVMEYYDNLVPKKNTLYIGFYDYSYYSSAFELKDNKFIEIDLDYKTFEAVYYLEVKDTEEWKRRRRLHILEPILKNYDEIIICEDGVYVYYSTKELLEELTKLRKSGPNYELPL